MRQTNLPLPYYSNSTFFIESCVLQKIKKIKHRAKHEVDKGLYKILQIQNLDLTLSSNFFQYLSHLSPNLSFKFICKGKSGVKKYDLYHSELLIVFLMWLEGTWSRIPHTVKQKGRNI